MSTDYTHFSNLAFTNLFARGPDGAESLLVNSSGAFVNVNISGNIATTGSLTAARIVTSFAGSASSVTISVASIGLGLYRVAAKQLGISAGSTNIATFTTAVLLVAKAIQGAFGSTASPGFSFSAAGSTGIVGGTSSLQVAVRGTSIATYSTITLTVSKLLTVKANATVSGTLVVSSTIGASNFSGTSSGTNTGDNVNASSSTVGLVSTGTQSFAGTKTFVTPLTGSNVASASSSASGVITTGTQSFAGTKTFVTPLAGSNVASASSSASGVITTGTQSIAGTKTFVTALAGSNVAAASSSASGVVNTSAQTFSGGKTFINAVTIKVAGQNNLLINRFINAGSGTSSVGMVVGNSGAAQGVGTFFYQNAAATASPNTLITHTPRNNGDTSNTDCARITMSKDAGGNGGSFTFQTANTSAALVNGLTIDSSQQVTIGTGTAGKHTLNSLLATNGAQTASMTNLPAAATAGNPNGWLSITINGTQSYIPFWH